MEFRSRQNPQVKLDLTPLIDVVFLLLIFFMVSTTFDKQTRMKVDLPSASEQTAEEQQPTRIQVTIDRAGNLYVDDRELVTHDLPTLKRAMEKIAEGRTDLPVEVNSDREAPFQSAVMVMDAAGQLGLTELSFVAVQNELRSE